jgi:hypothetical protein
MEEKILRQEEGREDGKENGIFRKEKIKLVKERK